MIQKPVHMSDIERWQIQNNLKKKKYFCIAQVDFLTSCDRTFLQSGV